MQLAYKQSTQTSVMKMYVASVHVYTLEYTSVFFTAIQWQGWSLKKQDVSFEAVKHAYSHRYASKHA